MTIWVNGEQVQAEEAKNLAALAERYGLVPSMTLIEHNGAALLRSEWQTRTLSEGDRIEFVRVVAGG